jgi:hypothetical protein
MASRLAARSAKHEQIVAGVRVAAERLLHFKLFMPLRISESGGQDRLLLFQTPAALSLLARDHIDLRHCPPTRNRSKERSSSPSDLAGASDIR